VQSFPNSQSASAHSDSSEPDAKPFEIITAARNPASCKEKRWWSYLEIVAVHMPVIPEKAGMTLGGDFSIRPRWSTCRS